jgi:glycosyltransferase involved in cell wall biosynthesis
MSIFTTRPGVLQHKEWDVPSFEVTILSARKNKYCLVIPVINEGNRLIDQLTSTLSHNHSQSLDIIIADGGSNDGSTTAEILSQYQVNTLLVKKDTGKLSAQLRMAYAWALEAGYEGIITIDGNGKDGTEALPKFIQALEDGYDYVQASRFLPGGEGINTPLSRLFAIRLIHAPILSLAAGKWLTDTTQGFRAYSARYLLHPKVQPFRKIFISYELLAYLSVRASQLGMKVKELPTRRAYPDNGKIPTKISGFSGNFGLMKVLMATLLKQYHPKHSHPESS